MCVCTTAVHQLMVLSPHRLIPPLPPHLQFIQEAGFSKVRAEDRTAQFIEVIKTELQRAEAIKDEFIKVGMHNHKVHTVCQRLHLHNCVTTES